VGGRVVILGSVNVDLTARTAVLPERGDTVAGSSFVRAGGGKGANQAVAAVRAGAEVVLCGAVGRDGFGDDAVADLGEAGVSTERVVRVDEPTGVALVLVEDSGENEIVVVAGANCRADGRGFDWRPGDVAAAVLEVPGAAVEAFFADAGAAGATTFLNAAPASEGAAKLCQLSDVVCVNERELAALGGVGDCACLVVTLGADGVRVVDADGELVLPAYDVEVVDTVGAGDALCGVLLASLAAGQTLREAVVRANAAGALAVQRFGARSSPSASEIDEFLRRRA
jgi:ribokinase